MQSQICQYQIVHKTRYEYESEVLQARHLLHLHPRQSAYQQSLRHRMHIVPQPTDQALIPDAFGNQVLQIVIDRPHAELHVDTEMEIELTARAEPDPEKLISWERVRDELSYASRPRSRNELEVLQYRQESPHIKLKNVFSEFASPCFGKGEPMLTCVVRLMNRLYETMKYVPGSTNTTTPLWEVLEKRQGVCQDFAHLMIGSLRSLGLSARYVSGYLRTVTKEPTAESKPKALVGADATHAWVSVYVPTLGWVDLDPTNNVLVNLDHVTLGWGRDFSDVSPLRGVITGGGTHKLSVGVSVKPMKMAAHVEDHDSAKSR
jgi:transglutaminase-like putative cysteine protease